MPFRIQKDFNGFSQQKHKELSSFIHIMTIIFVLSRSDVIHPILVIEVPTYSLFKTFFKLQIWPSELRRQKRYASPHYGRIDI